MNEELLKALNLKFEALQAELKVAQDAGATKEEVLKLHEAIKTQGLALEAAIEAAKEAQVVTFVQELKSFLAENAEEIKRIEKNKTGTITFVPKAVGAMSRASGGDVAAAPVNMNTNLGHFNLRNDEVLLGLASVTSTNSPVYPYTELQAKDGDYTFVAEGGTKPQTDFKWENRYAEPKKAAAYEVMSTEVIQDIARMESVAREYLTKKHGLHKANAIYFGDGLGQNPKGATAYGRTFSAGALALAVATPNFMDVVNACITDIYTTQNYTDETPYEANTVLINPNDFFIQLVSAKDANGLPLYPQAGLFNTVTIGGVTIKPWIKIPAGKIFCADMKQYHVANYIPFQITIGWINDQFITNQFTMVGESRYFAFVKKLDEQAFLYDTIATIKTAITKP